MTASNRPYNGVHSDERVATRRAKLLESGLEILGNPRGELDLTVRTICQVSGLAQRYFYESFADKDVFAGDVYDWALRRVIEATETALRTASHGAGTRAGLTGLVKTIATDRRIGELLFSPHQINSVIVAKRFESTYAFIALFSTQLGGAFRIDDAGHAPLSSHFLVGGVAQGIASWLNGEAVLTQEELVDGLVELLARHGVGAAEAT